MPLALTDDRLDQVLVLPDSALKLKFELTPQLGAARINDGRHPAMAAASSIRAEARDHLAHRHSGRSKPLIFIWMLALRFTI